MPAAGCSMTRARLQLASLWLLLMARLALTELEHKQKALVKVYPLRMESPNFTVEGIFAKVADVGPAEGRLIQVSVMGPGSTSARMLLHVCQGGVGTVVVCALPCCQR